MRLSEEIDLQHGRLDDMGVVRPEHYEDGREMTMTELMRMQRREMQSGRWQLLRARQYLVYAQQADSDAEGWRLLYGAVKLMSEGLYQNKSAKKMRRVKAVPGLGGRPQVAWNTRLYLATDNIIDDEGWSVKVAARAAVRRDEDLAGYFGLHTDEQLRKAFYNGKEKYLSINSLT